MKAFQQSSAVLTAVACLVLLLTAGCAGTRSTASSDILQLSYPTELRVVSRDQWGWSAGEGSLPNHIINKITIHHGGEDFAADRDVLDYLPTFLKWCREEKHWIDIPYHFMLDLQGNIYEARPINLPGDTNTSYDPAGHALICVLGNYEHQIVSEQQLNSIIMLTAFLAKRFSVSVDSIKGHKDYTETLCPGKDLYRYLQDGTIVKNVKERIVSQ